MAVKAVATNNFAVKKISNAAGVATISMTPTQAKQLIQNLESKLNRKKAIQLKATARNNEVTVTA